MISKRFFVLSFLFVVSLIGNFRQDKIKKSDLVGHALEDEQDFTLYKYAHKYLLKKNKKDSKVSRSVASRN